MKKLFMIVAALLSAPAVAMTPVRVPLTCGAGQMPLIVYTNYQGNTTVTTGLMGEAHQSPGRWHGDMLEWDVGQSSGNFHFALNIKTVALTVTPPAGYGAPLNDTTCREGV